MTITSRSEITSNTTTFPKYNDPKSILAVINVSNSNFLDADSGYIFQNLMIKSLAPQNYHFTVISPIEQETVSSNWVQAPFPTSKYEVRTNHYP